MNKQELLDELDLMRELIESGEIDTDEEGGIEVEGVAEALHSLASSLSPADDVTSEDMGEPDGDIGEEGDKLAALATRLTGMQNKMNAGPHFKASGTDVSDEDEKNVKGKKEKPKGSDFSKLSDKRKKNVAENMSNVDKYTRIGKMSKRWR
jgi:hypothetical protein